MEGDEEQRILLIMHKRERGGLARYYYLNRLIHQFDWVCVDEGTVLNWPKLTTGGCRCCWWCRLILGPFLFFGLVSQAPQFLIFLPKMLYIIHVIRRRGSGVHYKKAMMMDKGAAAGRNFGPPVRNLS